MLKGKIEIHNKVSIENIFDIENGTLGLIYTPGVACVATEISNKNELVYDYTSKWNNVAIISDGTRVLGLGNIGPEAISCLSSIFSIDNNFPSSYSILTLLVVFYLLSYIISKRISQTIQKPQKRS
jgi:hypothetical protein